MSSLNDDAAPVPAGPLAGTVVLDLSRILAGPWCTQMLADYGAEVIKIERPGCGDDTRAWGPPWMPGPEGERSDSTYFAAANRNKKSVSVDVATPEGQRIVRELAGCADVLIENFKVGDLARYGLDQASLRAAHPGLVYCSITGYGQTGPYASRPGYDFVFQGEGGLMSVTGERDDLPGGGPQKTGVAIADIVTGMYAASAILAALVRRAHTGQGEYIDLALLDCMAAFGANLAFNHLVTGAVPARYGNAHPALVPYQVFRTRDGHIIVAAGNDSQWKRFCRAMGCEHLADDVRYATGSGRIVNRDTLIPQIEPLFLAQDSAYWLDRLTAEGLPNGRINDYRGVFEHPQIVHRGMRVEMPDAHGRTVPGVANPVKFSQARVSYRQAAPALGQHTREVLGARLGLDDAELDALASRQII